MGGQSCARDRAADGSHSAPEDRRREPCLAGGVALNWVGNGRLLRDGPFKDIWIQPAAGDAGAALGVAQLIRYRHPDTTGRAPFPIR